MEIQEIQVFIDELGNVQIHVHGVRDNSCLDITRSLEEALGGEIEHREMTSDALLVETEEVVDRVWLKSRST